MIHILEPQLIVVVELQLVHFQLQVCSKRRLLLEIRLGHEDLLAEGEQLLVALRRADLLIAHVEHQQAPVLPHGEEVRVVVSHAHARDSARVALIVLHLVRKRKFPRLHAPRVRRCEEHPPRVAQHHLAQHGPRQIVLLDDVTVGDLLDLLVAADGEARLTVGRAHRTRVVTALQHALPHALEVLQVPLVHRPVHPARHNLGIIRRPTYRTYLPVVPAQVTEILARVRCKDVDRVAVDRSEHVPAVRELALAARLDRELLERPHIIHNHVEQPHLIAKTHEQMQAGGVQRKRVRLLVEILGQLQRLIDIVPHTHAFVKPTRGHERLAHARVYARDLPRVEGRGEEVEVGLVRFHNVCIRQVEAVQLIVVRRHHELLLRVGHGQVPDLDGIIIDAKHLGALVELLLVALIIDRDAAVVAPCHDTL
mmetsp:Transcript_17511/g.42724  ORF Transcript_17511/g.42724 Transcript_17511/m.42724 type:complete len:424 (+) Transcript_17511:1864-3135(+)